MKKIALFLILGLLAFACQKDEAPEPFEPLTCVELQSGYFVVYNKSANPYEFYLNGLKRVDIAGGGSYEIMAPMGENSLKMVQMSGFLLTPTVYEASFMLHQCETLVWQP